MGQRSTGSRLAAACVFMLTTTAAAKPPLCGLVAAHKTGRAGVQGHGSDTPRQADNEPLLVASACRHVFAVIVDEHVVDERRLGGAG